MVFFLKGLYWPSVVIWWDVWVCHGCLAFMTSDTPKWVWYTQVSFAFVSTLEYWALWRLTYWGDLSLGWLIGLKEVCVEGVIYVGLWVWWTSVGVCDSSMCVWLDPVVGSWAFVCMSSICQKGDYLLMLTPNYSRLYFVENFVVGWAISIMGCLAVLVGDVYCII